MDRLIYLAMSGAKATLQRQDSLANNLANASTTGFRDPHHRQQKISVHRASVFLSVSTAASYISAIIPACSSYIAATASALAPIV